MKLSVLGPRAGRRLRVLALAGAVLAGLAAPLALPAGSAYAGGWDDDGPGSGSTAPIDTSTENPDGFHCVGDQLYAKQSGRLWYDGAYPNCVSSSYERTSTITLCPVGFQVFRFYGSYARPAQAYTVSDLQLTDWCKNESTYTFWSPNPSDATGKVPGSPWYSPVANNPHGAYLPGDHFKSVGRTEFGRLGAGAPFSGAGDCARAQTATNPLEKFLTDPAVDASQRQEAARALYQSYLSLSRNGRYPRTALVTLGLSSIRRSGNGTVSLKFDTKDCSSVMDFVSTADPDRLSSGVERAKFKVTGVCYIPVDRLGWWYANSNGGGAYAYPSLARGTGGLRYSNYYGNTTYTAAEPRGADDGTADKYERYVLGTWRSTMYSWLMRQPLYSGKTQITPADPYKTTDGRRPTGKKQSVNQALAARTLRDQSRCRFGSQVAFDTSAPAKAPSAKVGLVMHNQQLFQTGGKARVQQVQVDYTAPKCVGTAAECKSAHVQMASLSYNLRVSGLAGYRQCPANSSTRCDYQIISSTKGSGAVQGTTTLQVVFYNPTMKTQKVRFTISGVQATYKYQQKLGDTELQLRDPVTGALIKVGTPGGSKWVTKKFTPSVSGTPVSVTKSGSSWYYDAPVISAVNQPLD